MKMQTHEGFAVSFGQQEFCHAVRTAWEGAWTKEAVGEGLRMQGLVLFNCDPLWANCPQYARVKPQHGLRPTPHQLFVMLNSAQSAYLSPKHLN